MRKAATVPTRWSFDMSKPGEAFEERVICGVVCDLPRVNDRLIGLPYRYAYFGIVDPTKPMQKSGPVGAGFNRIGRIDMQTGDCQSWYGDDDCSFQEPQFVPAGPGETDGYVICVIDRHSEHRADIGIFAYRRPDRAGVGVARGADCRAGRARARARRPHHPQLR